MDGWMDILPGGGLREAESEVYYDSYITMCVLTAI